MNKYKINITAHAGCMNTSMDSIEAIETGIKYRADIIEIDLNIDKNSNLVLSHDIPKEDVEYPQFKSVSDIIKSQKDILLNIDIKNTIILRWLKNVLFEYNLLDRVFLTGLTYNDLLDNKKFLQGINCFVNVESSDIENIGFGKLIDKLETLKIVGINIDYNLVNEEIISVCKERKFLTSVWTVDDPENMEKMIKLKVNSITTNRIDILMEKISEMKY